MKKILLLMFILLSVSSCKSEKDKVEELIRSYMFEVLYDYDSYQPISTEVTSSFSAKHKFRCKTAGGISRIHAWEFHYDKNKTEIISYYDDDGKIQLP